MRVFSLAHGSSPRGFSFCAAVAASCLVAPSFAQAQEPPAHIATVEGAVSIDRQNDTVNAVAGEPLVAGDRMRTGSGRAEVWFPDGSTLDLDAFTTAELQSNGLVRLTSGRVILVVAREVGAARTGTGQDAYQPGSYQIDTPAGSAVMNGPGEYKVTVSADGGADYVELAVVRGTAELLTDRGSMAVRSGERTFARADEGPSRPQVFNSARFDPFDAWANAQRDLRRGRAASAQYLPSNLQMYGGTFDRYGTWGYEPAYGYVWYPSVAPGWRPYYNGYWRPLPAYGYTWVGLDLWGWPTHHYGRWGYRGARWYWIPERRWAPAWVYWASAADYVSWCPLGFDNRPVFSFSLSVGNTWAGWVVMPRTYFGARNVYVNRYAFDGRRLPRNAAFAVHASAPIAPAWRGRVDAASRGDFRLASPSANVAVPRAPRGGDLRGGYARPRDPVRTPPAGSARTPSAPGARGRAYQANPPNPRLAAPGRAEPGRNGSAAAPFPRAIPRYRNPGQVASPPSGPDRGPASRQVAPRPFGQRSIDPGGPAPPRQESPAQQRPMYVPRRPMSVPAPQAAPTEPAAPQGPRDTGRAMRRPAPGGWGSGSPERSSAPFSRPEPRASAPPREAAPPARSGERAAPRGGSGDRSGGSGGSGGHGRRRP
jgi:hypothetical protein